MGELGRGQKFACFLYVSLNKNFFFCSRQSAIVIFDFCKITAQGWWNWPNTSCWHVWQREKHSDTIKNENKVIRKWSLIHTYCSTNLTKISCCKNWNQNRSRTNSTNFLFPPIPEALSCKPDFRWNSSSGLNTEWLEKMMMVGSCLFRDFSHILSLRKAFFSFSPGVKKHEERHHICCG